MEMAGSTEGRQAAQEESPGTSPTPTSSPGQRELWQGLICALGAVALHLSSSCCCRTSFSPPPLVFIGSWYLQKFTSSSLRLAKLWAKTFLAVFEVPKPQVLPREVLQQCCVAARQRRDGKEKQEDLESSRERESKNKIKLIPTECFVSEFNLNNMKGYGFFHPGHVTPVSNPNHQYFHSWVSQCDIVHVIYPQPLARPLGCPNVDP